MKLFINLFIMLFKCSYTLQTLTPKQKKMHDDILKHDLVIASGPAGTGKTMIATTTAIEMLDNNDIKKIVITRPLVSVENEDIGFLPGDVNQKVEPWMQNIRYILNKRYTNSKLDSMINSGIIEIAPMLFMRGRTFDNTFLICDEVQNTTPKQLKMLLSRIGEGSKIVVTGDSQQSDIETQNGFCDLKDRLIKYYGNEHGNEDYKMFNDHISIIEFSFDDVMRSLLCKKILEIYEGK